MKKLFFFMVILVVAVHVSAQTWTIRNCEHFDVETRVITPEQWDRLFEQSRSRNAWVQLRFVDRLEAPSRPDQQVIRGNPIRESPDIFF